MIGIEQIVEKYLDDRDQVSEGEMAALIGALRRSPELAAALKEQLLLNELLGQRYGVDRQNFIAQVEQRIRDYELDEQQLEEQVRDLRSLAEQEFEQWNLRHRRSRTRRVWITAAALLAMAAGLGAWMVFSPPWWRIAVVEFVKGSVTRPGAGGQEPVSAGDEVIDGDVYRTSTGQLLKFRYADGTLVQIGGDSSIQFAVDRLTNGKRVLVYHGNVAAKVKPQKAHRPMVFLTPVAEAEVLGTELCLTVEPTGTRLDVMQGSVKLTRTVDGASVWVEAGHYGVTTIDALTVHRRSWPARRSGLVFLFQTGDQPNFVTDPSTQMPRRCCVQPRGLASLNPDFAMVLGHGAFEARGIAEDLLAACRKSNQLTVEAVIRPSALQQGDPARIITFSSDGYHRNFSISQQDCHVIAQLRTSETDNDRLQPEIEICDLPDDQPHHLLLAYKPGRLVAYLDGRKCCEHQLLTGDFSNWSPQRLVFGDEPGGGYDWSGTLEGVAIYSRFLGADEAKRNANEYRELIRQRHARTGRKTLH